MRCKKCKNETQPGLTTCYDHRCENITYSKCEITHCMKDKKNTSRMFCYQHDHKWDKFNAENGSKYKDITECFKNYLKLVDGN